MSAYTTKPATAKATPMPFTIAISEDKVQAFSRLLKLSPIGPNTYENEQEDRRFGLTRKWLSEAKARWDIGFDWRSRERYLNSFPHYTLPVKDPLDGRTFTIHFIALFSTAPNATPLALYHGWPGSFVEFLPILDLLQKKYPDPATLPYHVVVPSLPGYAFSSKPPLDKDWSDYDSARILNQLMVELGLGGTVNGGVGGYVAQGGDIGSNIARIQAVQFDDCIAAHLNMVYMPQKPEGVPDDALDALEAQQLARGQEFVTTGTAYAREHGTRPATIGLVLSASPIALLAWIGEKFLAWTDQDPSVDTILESATLYWLTDTFPTAIYSYRAPKTINEYISKPLGYSYFPKEITPTPRSWVATTGNLLWHRQHSEGGHFAALEKPELLLGDVEDFIAQIKTAQGAATICV